MRLFGFEVRRSRPEFFADGTLTLDQLIARLDAAMATVSGIAVTPESAMASPTVQAIVQAVAGAMASLNIQVLRKTVSGGRAKKEIQPNHPLTKLLAAPNPSQDRVTYWLDATSWLIRYGNHYAVKVRGRTGPVRALESLPAGEVSVYRDNVTGAISYRFSVNEPYGQERIHHVRGPARDGYKGDSPVSDVREAIALEIAVEKFGASFFGNGAMPGLIFKYMQGSQGHKSNAARQQFLDEVRSAYGGPTRTMRPFLLPLGIEVVDPINLDNDKAQFLETRKYQRTVIAGAFGVPPHLVGDLERATFSNIEHQSLEFVQRVLLRYVRMFEAAMERDLLTPEDRAGGIIIRFHLDSLLRGDFQSRQAGLNIQRQAGVINANEWREYEGLNPRDDEGGELYWDTGPSGQGQEEPEPETPEEPEQPKKPEPEDEDEDEEPEKAKTGSNGGQPRAVARRFHDQP